MFAFNMLAAMKQPARTRRTTAETELKEVGRVGLKMQGLI